MKRFARIATVLAIAGIALFTVACSNGKAGGSKLSGDKSPITISVFTVQARQQPNADNKLYKYLKDKLGVTFSWDILVGEVAQKRGVMIASGDYPDMIEINETQFIGIVNISSVSKYPKFIQATDFTAVTLPL